VADLSLAPGHQARLRLVRECHNQRQLAVAEPAAILHLSIEPCLPEVDGVANGVNDVVQAHAGHHRCQVICLQVINGVCIINGYCSERNENGHADPGDRDRDARVVNHGAQ